MKNILKITKLSEVSYKFTSKQWNEFIDITKTIQETESLIKSFLSIHSSIFLNSLLEKEGIDSSRIEGTQTNHDELFFDIEGINNLYSWETRNLINLYKDTFVRLSKNNLRLNVERLMSMHERLYKTNLSQKWNNTFDASFVIKKIKPGCIITNDKQSNWIGKSFNDHKDVSLYPVKPSQKIIWLEDLFNTITKSITTNDRKIENLIFFHPIFEAIHPFADGNGRLGRILLTSLFKFLGLTQNNWFFFSDVIEPNKDEYLDALHHIQTTNDWNSWVDYFNNLLGDVASKRIKQIKGIIKLLSETMTILKLNKDLINTSNEGYILSLFIKYPRLNKTKTIEKIVRTKRMPIASAYRIFDKVANVIGAKKYNSNLYEFSSLLKIVRL